MADEEWLSLEEVNARVQALGLPAPTRPQLHRWAKAKRIERRQARAPGQIGSAPTEYASWCFEVIIGLLREGGGERRLDRRLASHWLKTGQHPPNRPARELLIEGCGPVIDFFTDVVKRAGSVEAAHREALRRVRQTRLGRAVLGTPYLGAMVQYVTAIMMGADPQPLASPQLQRVYRGVIGLSPLMQSALDYISYGALSVAHYPKLIDAVDDEAIEMGRRAASIVDSEIDHFLALITKEARSLAARTIANVMTTAVTRGRKTFPFIVGTLTAIIVQNEPATRERVRTLLHGGAASRN